MFPNGEKPNAENVKEIMLAADTNEDGEVGRRRPRVTCPSPHVPTAPLAPLAAKQNRGQLWLAGGWLECDRWLVSNKSVYERLGP
jgi:hypothetical protein